MYNSKDLNLCGANRDAEIRSPKASNNMPWQVKFENHLPACLPGMQCFLFFIFFSSSSSYDLFWASGFAGSVVEILNHSPSVRLGVNHWMGKAYFKWKWILNINFTCNVTNKKTKNKKRNPTPPKHLKKKRKQKQIHVHTPPR